MYVTNACKVSYEIVKYIILSSVLKFHTFMGLSLSTNGSQVKSIDVCSLVIESLALLQTTVPENYHNHPHDEKNIGVIFSFTGGYRKVLLARE